MKSNIEKRTEYSDKFFEGCERAMMDTTKAGKIIGTNNEKILNLKLAITELEKEIEVAHNTIINSEIFLMRIIGDLYDKKEGK